MTATQAPTAGRRSVVELDDGRVLLVAHAADRSGAPLLLLWWLRWATAHSSIRFEVLVLRDGPLVAEFSQLAPTHLIDVYSPAEGPRAELAAILERHDQLHRRRRSEARQAGRALGRFDVVVLNSSLAGVGLDLLVERPPVVISWLHDMGTSLRRHTPEESRRAVLSADWFVTCADAVTETLVGTFGVPRERIARHHGFIEPLAHDPAASLAIREQLGIPEGALVVGGAGTRQWRKGTDLFVQVVDTIRRLRPDLDVHGVWAGGADPFGDAPPAADDARAMGIGHRFHVLDGYTSAAATLGAFDVFCLTSREDPFPLVMLEAAWLSLPIVAFDNGGVRELAAAGGGDPLVTVTGYLDVDGFADATVTLLDDADRRSLEGRRLRRWVEEHHVADHGAPLLLDDLRGMVRSGSSTVATSSPSPPISLAPSTTLVTADGGRRG